MMNRKTTKLIAAIVAGLLVFTMVISVIASSVSYAGAVNSISGLKKELSSIDEQKQEVKDEIAELNKKINVVSEKKAALDKQMGLTQDEIDTTEKLIDELNRQIEDKQTELIAAEAALVEKTDLFTTRVRVMYENGEITYLDVLLESNNLEDMMSRIDIVGQIMDYDKQVVKEFTAAKQDIAERKLALETDQNDQKTYQDGLQDKYDSLDKQQDEQKALLYNLNEDMDAKKAEEEKMLAEQESINDEIARLSAEAAKAAKAAKAKAAAEAAARNASSGGASSASYDDSVAAPMSGTFTWPLPGYGSGSISSPYGYRNHPISGKRKLHAGLDLGAPKGTQIVAAANGIVVKSYMSNSYGNYTVISHGDGVMTAYAHQSKRLVGEGDTVAAGQVIGQVGSTGNSTGNHLHFEVYVNGSTTNPMNYFN